MALKQRTPTKNEMTYTVVSFAGGGWGMIRVEIQNDGSQMRWSNDDGDEFTYNTDKKDLKVIRDAIDKVIAKK